MLSRFLPERLDNDFRGYQAAIWIFALITVMKLGLEQLLLGALFVVVLLRYRALIPLMLLLALAAQAGAFALAACKPLALTIASGAAPVHLARSGLYIAGLVLALLERRSAGATAGTGAR